MRSRLLSIGAILLIAELGHAEMTTEYRPYQNFPHIDKKLRLAHDICSRSEPASHEKLLKILAEDENFIVIRAASRCLSETGSPEQLPALATALRLAPQRPLFHWPLSFRVKYLKTLQVLTREGLIEQTMLAITARAPQLSPQIVAELRAEHAQFPSPQLANVLATMDANQKATEQVLVQVPTKQAVTGPMASLILRQLQADPKVTKTQSSTGAVVYTHHYEGGLVTCTEYKQNEMTELVITCAEVEEKAAPSQTPET